MRLTRFGFGVVLAALVTLFGAATSGNNLLYLVNGMVISILAVSVLAFARTLGDFGITIMIAGNIPGRTQTIAVAIYDAVESGNGALARTLVLVISVLALAVLSIANRLAAKQVAG